MVDIAVQPDYVVFNRSKREAQQLRVAPMHVVPMPHVVGAHVEDRSNGTAVLALEVRGNPGVDPAAHSVELSREDAERLRDLVAMHAAGEEATPWGARLPQEVGQAIAQVQAQHDLERSNRSTDRMMWASLGVLALPLVVGAIVFVVVLVAIFVII